MALKLGVFGAAGRMGRAVLQLAPAFEFELVCAVGGKASVGQDTGMLAGGPPSGVHVLSAPDPAAGVQVWVDFAPAEGLELRAAQVTASGAAWVCGSTGLGAAQLEVLEQSARLVPVLWEPNFSVGVHVLSRLVREAAAQLGEEFQLEIVEAHHRAKRDAPSGTAKRLAEASGRPDVTMHALRGGDIIGDHHAHFMGPGERLELSHRATDRALFARGALRAAAWASGRAPGRYTLADVLAGTR